MRLLFASDLHGHAPAYRDLFDRARSSRPDAVVLGGDLLPHPSDRARLLEVQVDFAQDILRPLVEALHRDAPEVPVFAVPGNDDWLAAARLLDAWADIGLTVVSGRAVPVADRFVAGCPYVPVTPFYMSDFDRFDAPGWAPAIEPSDVWLSDRGEVYAADLEALRGRPTIEAELAALAEHSDPARTVYVIHGPPHDTALDVMRNGAHIGSPALRRFVEARRPPLTLHGHVHESHRMTGQVEDRIGPTVCVNVGPSLAGLRAAEIEWADAIEVRVWTP